MRNIGLKILALGIALILYFFVHSQTNSSVISLVVPIELRNLPKDRLVLLPALKQAQVTIKGPSFLLREVAISAPIFRMDLPAGVSDRHELVLTGEDLRLPATIEVVSIIPSRIELIFDKIVSKQVKIEVPKLGALPEDVRLKGIKIEPDFIKVTGPETELRGLTSVQTQPLNLTGLTEDLETELKLVSVGSNSKFSNDNVKVNAELEVVLTSKKFTDLPIEIQAANSDQLEIIPESASILVQGQSTKLEKLKSEDVKLFIVASAEIVSKGQAQITVTLPEGFNVEQVIPKHVKLVHRRVG